jgi:hypothetical protein
VTRDELKRLQNYSDRINASQEGVPVLEILVADEHKDLSDLLNKWQDENEWEEEEVMSMNIKS